MAKQTELKEEVKKEFEKRGMLAEKKKPEQPNLFGDQDFVYNVLETDLTDINSSIVRAQDAIDKKKIEIDELQDRKSEVIKAIKIVRKQKKELEKKVKKEESK